MKQVALGDDYIGWTVLDGRAITAPFLYSAVHFSPSADPILKENVEITLSGTPSQISTAVRTLEGIRQRAIQYDLGAYKYPQFLRFQQTDSVTYFYTPISDIHFEINPAGYLSRQKGAATLLMHYSRPNYFEGAYKALTLTDVSGVEHASGINLLNHFDSGVGHSNTLMIKPGAFSTELPAALRLEIENTYATGSLKDIWVGIYHHPTETGHRFFYGLYSDMTGGTAIPHANAIEGSYRTITWTASTYSALFNMPISSDDVHRLDGRWYRPIVHLFAALAYPDLYFRIYLVSGTDILETGEPIYADSSYQYLVFPPIQVPPNHLLRETSPNAVEVVIYGLKADGTTATITIDQILLLPLDPAVTLRGFFGMAQGDTFVYDASRGLQNVRYSVNAYETVAHILQGSTLTLYPGEYNRLIFVLTNTANQVDIDRSFTVKAYYRERVRFV